MYNNVDIISETYEDITSVKLQIRRFQPSHSRQTDRRMICNRNTALCTIAR